MFYGLNKFIKNLLPKQLFYRALLIVATPIIILQITISIVFFDSLWIKTNKGMTRALVGEIKFFDYVYSYFFILKESTIIINLCDLTSHIRGAIFRHRARTKYKISSICTNTFKTTTFSIKRFARCNFLQ